MKYFDEMGKDVTSYVQGLEQKIKELEVKVVPSVCMPISDVPMICGDAGEICIGVVEKEKPKRKRRSKKKLDANPQ